MNDFREQFVVGFVLGNAVGVAALVVWAVLETL